MENTLLNLIPSTYCPEVHLSQYDIGRTLVFKLMDGTSEYNVPSGATIKVKATKPSGLGFEVSCTYSDGTVTLVNTETMTKEYGRFPAELSITSNGTVLGTSNFVFNIEKSPHQEGTTDGDADTLIPELTLLVERAEEASLSVINIEPQVEALTEWQGGAGTIVFEIIAQTGMTSISTSQYLSRDKLTNKLYCYIMSKNETGESIATNTNLFKIPSIDLSYASIILRGIMTVVINSNGTREFGTAFIRKVNDSYYITVNIAIPDGATLVIIGECSTSPAISLLLNKGYYNQSLAEGICDNVLHGSEDYSWWRQGAFQYSNSDSVRLNPANKKTDCTGIIYMAFQLLGIHPRGSVPKAILPDGMLISYAIAGNPLDLSLAKAGDIICYKRSGETSVTHCSLYAGNNTIYEMAQTYPDAGQNVIDGDTYEGQPNQEKIITNGYGPYIIPTSASIYRMSNYTRYLVRYL